MAGLLSPWRMPGRLAAQRWLSLGDVNLCPQLQIWYEEWAAGHLIQTCLFACTILLSVYCSAEIDQFGTDLAVVNVCCAIWYLVFSWWQQCNWCFNGAFKLVLCVFWQILTSFENAYLPSCSIMHFSLNIRTRWVTSAAVLTEVDSAPPAWMGGDSGR